MRRGCGLPVAFLAWSSLHRTVSTSDVPIVTRRHTRVGILVRPMCCPNAWLLAENEPELDLRVRGLLRRLAGEGKTGICPRTPSIVSRTCEPKPTGHGCGNLIREPAPTRTVSPSVHSRPASGGAANFFLASALCHHSALQPTGEEDTRYDQPMSATHTNYVHPHLARSQLALATFAAGTLHGVLGSVT